MFIIKWKAIHWGTKPSEKIRLGVWDGNEELYYLKFSLVQTKLKWHRLNVAHQNEEGKWVNKSIFLVILICDSTLTMAVNIVG